MTYNPDIHHRRSVRLKGYDYSQAGLYFITICTQNRSYIFGKIVGAGSKLAQNNGTHRMKLNDCGRIVEQTWFDLTNHVYNIQLHEFVVMPNHIHGIIEITDDNHAINQRAGLEPAPTTADKRVPISEIVRQLKTFSAKRINQLRNKQGTPVWHRNYYEHIIRTDKELNHLREYIINNPLKWLEDQYYE